MTTNHRRWWLTFAALVITLAFPRQAPAETIVIRAGRLLDPATGLVSSNQLIVIENGRVVAVGPRSMVAIPPGAQVIDLSGLTVMPGLIDGHVHLGIGGSVRDNALADLRAGFTTVVDLGERTNRILRLRDSINAGFIPGPRVYAAGIWVGTKNGVCEFNGIGISGGPEAFVSRVRENIDAGADVIKVCVSSWPADAYREPKVYEITDNALRAVVAQAHQSHRLVVAHDISTAGVGAALRSSVDILAHAAYVDDALARQLRARGISIIPTLASLTSGDSSAGARELVAATRRSYRNGVRLVFGTDGGVLPHGRNALEFSALHDAGVSSIDAIRSATINAARAFQISDSVGTIAVGMVADVIAVDGDPLADVGAMTRVKFVMSRGQVVRRD